MKRSVMLRTRQQQRDKDLQHASYLVGKHEALIYGNRRRPPDENTKRPCGQACGEVVAVATEEKSRRALSAKEVTGGCSYELVPIAVCIGCLADPTSGLISILTAALLIGCAVARLTGLQPSSSEPRRLGHCQSSLLAIRPNAQHNT
jgi:hypothetical protein